MKKIIALGISSLLVLTGCSSGTASYGSAVNPKQTEKTIEQGKKNHSKFKTDATIEEQVLYDSDGVKITAKSLEYDSHSATLNFLIENNSEKAVSVTTGSMGYSCNSVNNWMISDGWFNTTIDPGKKANESSDFDIDNLQEYGINEIGTIEMGFEIEDPDTYDSVYTGPIEIKTDKADKVKDTDMSLKDMAATASSVSGTIESVIYESKDTIFDENDVVINEVIAEKNSDNEKSLLMLAENNSDSQQNISTSDIYINDYSVCSGRWDITTINAGKKAVIDMNFNDMVDDEDQDSIGMDNIAKVDFSLGLLNDDYDSVNGTTPVTLQLGDSGKKKQADGNELYNANNIVITSMGLSEDDSYVHWKWQIKNNNDFEIIVSDEFDSFSIDDYMVDCIMYSNTIAPGKTAIADVKIFKEELEKNGINKDSIGKVQIKIDIKNEDYDDIDTADISEEFQKKS